MANEKILDVTYPGITSWQWHATLFSILGNDEKLTETNLSISKLKLLFRVSIARAGPPKAYA